MIEIEKIVDHPDGSATLTILLSEEDLKTFASVAILDALKSVARQQAMNDLVKVSQEMGLYDDKDDIECRSRNPAKMCEGCTCWKNQNE